MLKAIGGDCAGALTICASRSVAAAPTSPRYAALTEEQLAPFYDLVCTRNYKNLAREMAMSLGGAWDPDLVNAKHLSGLANDLGVRASIVMDQAKELADRIVLALPLVVEDYRRQFGESPVLERLPIVIRKLVRRVNSQLK